MNVSSCPITKLQLPDFPHLLGDWGAVVPREWVHAVFTAAPRHSDNRPGPTATLQALSFIHGGPREGGLERRRVGVLLGAAVWSQITREVPCISLFLGCLSRRVPGPAQLWRPRTFPSILELKSHLPYFQVCICKLPVFRCLFFLSLAFFY